ncbi:KAP family P-loop NTPase fold protein [Pseudomonas xanthosomatis]|uniref:KAP family P-loop NTPase fold protein n=1 Tax=Pseudomonas xanthosomatis TaxID=2842356 RepID=UPI0035120F26
MTDILTNLKKWFAARRPQANEDPASVRSVEIGSEAPIRSASEDKLRRGDFAHRIAGVLSELSLREGRVFAIRGGWGYGKSSLKHLVIEQLEARSDGADWLDFNPWQWGDGDAISRALFGQLANRLGGDHSKEAIARAEALRRYGAILTGASAPLKNVSGNNQQISSFLTNSSVLVVAAAIGFNLPEVASVAAVLAGLSLAASLVGRILSHLGRDRSGESLDKIRESLEKRLRGLDRPLIVFVDDIDRLEPDQIRVLLRQVKANANLPNIVFVLLFQPSIVERALDPVADGDGRAFLEKIVQANFDLPAVPLHMVHRLFAEQLGQMAIQYAKESNGFTTPRWGNALLGCIQPRLHNMRDAHRLLSSIAVHLPLHASGDLFEVNLVDFLVLESLRVFEPDLHLALFQERALVLQEHGSSGRRDVVESAVQKLLETVPESRRELARDTVKELFPSVSWALGGPRYGDSFHTQWLTAKRVCSPRFFPRYFELQTALGEISERRFVEFLDASSAEQSFVDSLASIVRDGLLLSLVARLDESVDRLPIENAAVLLPGMFQIAQSLVRSHSDPFSSPYVAAWRATSWYLERIPEDERGPLVLGALRTTEALSISSMLIYLNDPADRTPNVEFNPALDLETIQTMKALWLELIRARAADVDALIKSPGLDHLLYRWKDYSGSIEEPQVWVKSAIQTDEGFAMIASALMSTGTSHTVGDRVSKVHNIFNRETVTDFIGQDLARARYESIDPSNYPQHEVALRSLGAHLEAWFNKEGFPFLDT